MAEGKPFCTLVLEGFESDFQHLALAGRVADRIVEVA